MKRGAGAYLVAALLASPLLPQTAWAQMQPHRAEYSLRLGTAVNATRIGTAVQDITLDCTGWRLRRDVTVEVSLTPSLKLSVKSRLEGDEARRGPAFTYTTFQVLNGVERTTSGKVARRDSELVVEMAMPDGPETAVLPALTLMPVAAVSYLVKRLALGATPSFPLLMFGAEGTGAAFLLDVKELDPGAFQTVPPALKRVDVPSPRSWPLLATVTRAGQSDDKALLSLKARIFASGVLDRLTIDAGPVTVAAYLQALEMHPIPTCPAP